MSTYLDPSDVDLIERTIREQVATAMLDLAKGLREASYNTTSETADPCDQATAIAKRETLDEVADRIDTAFGVDSSKHTRYWRREG